MIRESIQKVVSGENLSATEAETAMEEIMAGEATPAQFGAFVTALRIKGETSLEIAGMAKVMRQKAVPVTSAAKVVDTCGTGGDGSQTINVSTMAAFVAVGAGLTIAKHGNRAITSACGSADVLEAAGVNINLGPEGVQQCIEKVGMGFMFAPNFHPAMKYAGGPRREIGIRTVFNILGPLTNPASAKNQVLGVSDPSLGEKMAQVLMHLGSQHSLVVHGEDGMDEISITAPTHIWELLEGSIVNYVITPEEFGLTRASPDSVRGGSAEQNVSIMQDIFSGALGPKRDIVLMNAAAALVAGDAAKDIPTGLRMAAESIDTGQASTKLLSLSQISQTTA